MKWRTIKLGEVVKINPRLSAALKAEPPDRVAFLGMASVSEDGMITGTETRKYSEVRKGFTYFEEGDILLAKITPCMENGKAAEAVGLPHRVGFGSTEFHVLRAGPKVHRRFLFYFVWSAAFREDAKRHMAGAAGQKRVPSDYLRELEIPLPPLDEQRRIAAVLDKADALRRQRQESLRLTEQLLQSVFIDMFGDPLSNPKGWTRRVLDGVCKRIVDCPHSTPHWTDTGVVCLRTSNLGNGRFAWDDTRYISEEEHTERTRRLSLEAGDIILSREGTVGIAAIVPKGLRMSMGQRLVQLRLDPRTALPQFVLRLLLWILAPERIAHVMVGSTSKHLNVGELRGLEVICPPIELQQSFETFSSRLLDQGLGLADSSSTLGCLFSSLQQRAFRGELDLSRLTLGDEDETPTETPAAVAGTPAGPSRRSRGVVAPPEVEARLVVLDKELESKSGDGIAWSEEYFKYRILGQTLQPPYCFDQILEAVQRHMPEAGYETIKDRVLGYVEDGTLRQRFDGKQRGIVFFPRRA